MIKVVCVLKSCEDYSWDYANKLYENVRRNSLYEFEFIILTNLEKFDVAHNIKILPLTTGLETYWAKLEIFKIKGQVVYFDLDTIIVNRIDELLKAIEFSSDAKKHFWMMEAISDKRKFASGIMAWHGDFSFILYQLPTNYIEKYDKWEQDYIVDRLEKNNIYIHSINDYINLASYKRDCKNKVYPMVDVICFHGKPRPRDINWFVGGKQF